jgi:hypothetical protein
MFKAIFHNYWSGIPDGIRYGDAEQIIKTAALTGRDAARVKELQPGERHGKYYLTIERIK